MSSSQRSASLILNSFNHQLSINLRSLMFPPSRSQDADAPIRSTDNDAAIARLSAVQRGYFEDPFIKYFVPRAHLQPPRPPLINVGTFVRSTGIDDLIDQWLLLSKHNGKRCQIVSLGAGSDTRFWRISTGAQSDNLASYVELDFPEITFKKAMAIKKSRTLSEVLGNAEDVFLAHGETALHSPKYHLLPVDLRVPPSENLEKLLSSSPSDRSDSDSAPLLSSFLPTLLLFECVLVYMTPDASSQLLQWFTNYFSRDNSAESGSGVLGCVVYEMFGLNDSFGRVMMNNLKARNISLPGAEPFRSFDSLKNRFLENGFTAARALTLREIRRAYIDPTELTKISKLEMLDEMEELDLVLEHYAISWGLLVSSSGSSANWGEWGLKLKGGSTSD